MTNADKFKNIFGLYATELWSMPEKDFLKWLNSEAMNCSEIPNNSDLISRQAAIDAARDWYEGLICGSFKGLEKRLRALPPAQPEPKRGKTGRWMATEADEPCFYRCSECGRLIDERENFCPNCGVDMRGEQDE